METIPRDATPTWAKPKYPPVPQDAPPQFTTTPIPLVLPDFPFIPPSLDTVLNLQWDTGGKDDITTYGGTPSLWVAVVVGTWPLGTEFNWTIDAPDFASSLRTEAENAVALVIDTTGVIVVSVEVTAPNSEAQTLGPITLTVTNYGCC